MSCEHPLNAIVNLTDSISSEVENETHQKKMPSYQILVT
jgi:hypothetical protein